MLLVVSNTVNHRGSPAIDWFDLPGPGVWVEVRADQAYMQNNCRFAVLFTGGDGYLSHAPGRASFTLPIDAEMSGGIIPGGIWNYFEFDWREHNGLAPRIYLAAGLANQQAHIHFTRATTVILEGKLP